MSAAASTAWARMVTSSFISIPTVDGDRRGVSGLAVPLVSQISATVALLPAPAACRFFYPVTSECVVVAR